jgi:two-component system, sensor histidine kinase YesM
LTRILRFLQPSTLKNRLFLAFLLLIILPFFVMQLRNHYQVKNLYEQRISEQSHYQLDQVKQSFEVVKSGMLMTALRLEKDRDVLSALASDKQSTTIDASIVKPDAAGKLHPIVSAFQSVKNQQLPDGDFLHYTLSDLQSRLYASFESTRTGKFTYTGFMELPAVQKLLQGQEPYVWTTEDTDAGLNSGAQPSKAVNLYLTLKDTAGQPIGLLRISFDYQQWLLKNMKSFLIQQHYYVLDGSGSVLVTSPGSVMPDGLPKIAEKLRYSGPLSYEVDEATSSIISSTYLPSMGWFLAAQFPLEVFFGDIRAMNRQFLITFILFTLLFIVITFFILSAITRPLMLLKKKMSEIIEKNFLTYISTDSYKGEILDIANTFNNMVKDLLQLIDRLKMEERQKEVIRFQMLLQQMNPHFLLNTLNTIKWNALSKGDQASAEICMSLGKLLESSLNSEADLIHLYEELELVRAYASIQNYRYDHRFEVQYDFEPRLGYALVPKLSLQPLVENAIQHGFAKMKSGGTIIIRIYTNGTSVLILEVEDNGRGLQPVEAAIPRRRKPIGMKNLRERLHLLFKAGAGLELEGLPIGARARMHLPLLLSPPYEQGGAADVESTARRG